MRLVPTATKAQRPGNDSPTFKAFLVELAFADIRYLDESNLKIHSPKLITVRHIADETDKAEANEVRTFLTREVSRLLLLRCRAPMVKQPS